MAETAGEGRLMSRDPVRILVVEDEAGHAELIRRAFRGSPWPAELTVAETLREARSVLAERPPDLILTDLQLPDGRGMELLAPDSRRPAFPIVVMTGYGDEQAAVDAIKGGALDYVVKSDDTLRNLPQLAQRALREWDNIVARQQAEEQLRQAKQDWEQTFQAVGHSMVILDPGHRVIAANQATVEITGKPLGELLGMRCFEVFHDGASSPPAMCPMEAVLKTGDTKTIDEEVEAFGRVFLVSCTPVFDASGSLEKIIHVATDVTERKRVEQAFRESTKRYKALVDTSPIAVIELDLSGRITYVSPTALRLYGTTDPNDLLGRNAADLIGQDQRAKILDGFARTLAKDVSLNNEYVVRRKDGSEFTAEISTAVLRDPLGHPKAFMAILQDITERKQAEEHLRRMETQLAHVARLSTMGEMVAGIAHEVNQPLYSVLNFAKASKNILEAHGSPNLTDLRDWNEEIAAAAARAGDIINRLRNFVRRDGVERRESSICEIIGESVAMVASEARQRGVAVHWQPCDEPVMANVDRVQIQQVVVNLLRNAYEAMEGVDDRPRAARVTVSVADSQVDVAVADTGVGLPEADHQNIFHAFVTTKARGLGMGLAIGRTIVEAHGGDLWAVPDPGGGTVFHFTLPLAGAARENRESDP